MTLNDLERRNSPYFAFFTEFDIFAGQLRHSGRRRPIMSAKYCLPVPVSHFWPKLTHPAARSLCDSRATCTTCKLITATSIGFRRILPIVLKKNRPQNLQAVSRNVTLQNSSYKYKRWLAKFVAKYCQKGKVKVKVNVDLYSALS